MENSEDFSRDIGQPVERPIEQRPTLDEEGRLNLLKRLTNRFDADPLVRIIDGSLVKTEEERVEHFKSLGIECQSYLQRSKEIALDLVRAKLRGEGYEQKYQPEDLTALHKKFRQLKEGLGDDIHYINEEEILIDQNGMFVIVV